MAGEAGETVPFYSAAHSHRGLEARLEQALLDVLRRGSYVLGPQVRAFEAELAGALGVSQAVGVASGSDALYLSLAAMEFDSGAEVITSPFTFIAPVEAIRRAGGRVVFCDIEADGLNIAGRDVEERVGARTAGVLPVHLFGIPCDLDSLLEVTTRRALFLIEDVAQAIGSTWKGRALGSFGAAAALSFYPTKVLGAVGDGGAVLSNSAAVASRCRALRNHGATRQYRYEVSGINSRLDEIQAATLRVGLAHLAAAVEERRRVASRYDEALSAVEWIRPLPVPRHAHVAPGVYTVLVPEGRDALRSHLERRRIASGIYYPRPLHLEPAFEDLGHRVGDFPNAERACRAVLSLPIFPNMPARWVERVVTALLEWRPPAARG